MFPVLFVSIELFKIQFSYDVRILGTKIKLRIVKKYVNDYAEA